MADGPPLAHGLGGPADLPISPELAIAGAVAALVVSFTVLALAWRTPRYDSDTSGRPAPAWLSRLIESPAYAAALRVIGLLGLGWFALAAVLGRNLLTNPAFGMFYVWWWVGLVPLSVLLGPVWKAISPVRTINTLFARVSGSDPDRGLYAYPERLGHWPAAVGLFAFVWLELVYPFSTELGPVRLWCAGYLALMLLGGALFGSAFYEKADPFEVYSTLCSKLSVWGRRDGVLVLRSPLANLDTVAPLPGPGRRGRGAVRQHRLRLVPRLAGVDPFHAGDHGLDLPARQPGAAGLLCRGGGDPRDRQRRDGGRGRNPPPGRSRPSSRTRWCRSSSATSWPTT